MSAPESGTTRTPRSEPLTDKQLAEIRTQTEEIIRVFGDDWPLDYEDEWPNVSCRYEDSDAPFTDVWIDLFSTSQRPDVDKDHSPLAEWLASAIKVVPALLAEVERLRGVAASADHGRMLVQYAGTELNTVAAERDEARAEAERLRLVESASIGAHALLADAEQLARGLDAENRRFREADMRAVTLRAEVQRLSFLAGEVAP